MWRMLVMTRTGEILTDIQQPPHTRTKCFNSNYMDFGGYETCDKLIWTSDEGCRNKNTISKQGIPKSNMNKKSPSSTFGFGCSSHNDTCDILSGYLVPHISTEYS